MTEIMRELSSAFEAIGRLTYQVGAGATGSDGCEVALREARAALHHLRTLEDALVRQLATLKAQERLADETWAARVRELREAAAKPVTADDLLKAFRP